MRTGRLVSVQRFGAGLVGLDEFGCLWFKERLGYDWQREETPHEQLRRLTPAWQKSTRKKQVKKP